MKLKKGLLTVFSVLPLVVSGIALFFLPDRIPGHYGADLTVDRYGSKYEILIFPPIILIIGLIFLLAAKLIQEEPNKRITLNIGLALVLFFNALNYFVLYVQANAIKDIGKFGFNRFLLLAFGVFFIFIGNLMPMVRKNAFIGMRTKWSMKNDAVWKKCQLFAGVSMIVAGVICGVLAFAWPELFAMVGVLIAVVIVNVIYSYFAAKKYENKE